jgi:short-subunit dehydrogenase
MNLDHKRLVLNGASSGIGRALLQQLSERQVQIVAVGRDETRLLAAVESVSASQARVMSFPCDLSRQRGVDALFDYAIQQMSGIDIFVANAGFAYWEPIQEPDWGGIEAIFQTNVFSPLYSAQKMHKLFHGADYRVLITSSLLDRIGLAGYALYASTKAAVDRFAEVYRLESRKQRRLVLVYPLAVRSRFFEVAGGGPVPWLSQSPESVARAILRGIERDRETIYTSWILRPMLLIYHLLPFTGRWYQAIDAKVFRRHWATQEKKASQGGSGQGR